VRALNFVDLGRAHGGRVEGLRDVRSAALGSDWLRTRCRIKGIVRALRSTRDHVNYFEAESLHDHDAFLLGREQKKGIGAVCPAIAARTFTAAKES
jgi:homoserine acetyltransferase